MNYSTLKNHPLNNFSPDDKINYLKILSYLCFIDNDFCLSERQVLDSYCMHFDIPERIKQETIREIQNYKFEDIRKIISNLIEKNGIDIKATLIRDLEILSAVDQKITIEEYNFLSNLIETKF